MGLVPTRFLRYNGKLYEGYAFCISFICYIARIALLLQHTYYIIYTYFCHGSPEIKKLAPLMILTMLLTLCACGRQCGDKPSEKTSDSVPEACSAYYDYTSLEPIVSENSGCRSRTTPKSARPTTSVCGTMASIRLSRRAATAVTRSTSYDDRPHGRRVI